MLHYQYRAGGGGGGFPLNSGCQFFIKGPTFGIISRHHFLADEPQNFF